MWEISTTLWFVCAQSGTILGCMIWKNIYQVCGGIKITNCNSATAGSHFLLQKYFWSKNTFLVLRTKFVSIKLTKKQKFENQFSLRTLFLNQYKVCTENFEMKLLSKLQYLLMQLQGVQFRNLLATNFKPTDQMHGKLILFIVM